MIYIWARNKTKLILLYWHWHFWVPLLDKFIQNGAQENKEGQHGKRTQAWRQHGIKMVMESNTSSPEENLCVLSWTI